jgi:hypothetical protein
MIFEKGVLGDLTSFNLSESQKFKVSVHQKAILFLETA